MNKKKRLIELSWKLLAYKLMYYQSEKVDPSWRNDLEISDIAYDALEKEAVKLGWKECIGFPSDRPSAKLVMKKYGCCKEYKN